MNIRNVWSGNAKVSGCVVAVIGMTAIWITQSSPAAGRLQASATPSGQAPAPAPQQPSEVAVVISGDPGTPPRYAVPEFIALTPDAAEIAKTVGQVLWDDLSFE